MLTSPGPGGLITIDLCPLLNGGWSQMDYCLCSLHLVRTQDGSGRDHVGSQGSSESGTAKIEVGQEGSPTAIS